MVSRPRKMLRRPHSIALALLVVLLLNADSSVKALTCPECTNAYKAEFCTTPTCPLGLAKGICGCCDVCLKGENEECGGLWNRGGTCAAGFNCTMSLGWQVPGVCVSVTEPACPDCTAQYKAQHCPISTCALGLTKDRCSCCDACLKDENDECGGIWNRGGTCAEGLQCVYDSFTWPKPGVCFRVNSTDAP